MRSLTCFISVWLALVLGPLAMAQPPQAAASGKGVGDLMILPVRVVLEGRTRASEVMLKNAGSAPATYRISLQEMLMTPDGQLQERTKGPGELTAADVIRFSPRQVELAPGETQIVRIQVRKPEDLPAGEYRSHMVFQGVPPAEPPAAADANPVKKDISISIQPIYGISIPIIVRHGETTASITMGNIEFHPAPSDQYLPFVSLELQRRGNRSVLGDMEVVVESGGSIKRGTVIGQNKGIAIYSNLAVRKVMIPFRGEKNSKLKGCKLKLTYTPRDMKGAPVVSELLVP